MVERQQASQHQAPRKEQTGHGQQERGDKYHQPPPVHSTPFPPPYPRPGKDQASAHVYPPGKY